MSVREQGFRDLARAALAELDADEPNTSPADLLGGSLAWDESWVTKVEARRDPRNAPTMHPHVVAPCQKLQRHPAMRLHCSCGGGLDYLALASFATGVLVVSSPHLREPASLRTGGTEDLAAVDDESPDGSWAFMPWETMMRRRNGSHRSAWSPHDGHPVLGEGGGVVGDYAKRHTFACGRERCRATPTFANIQLLRYFLRAIVRGERQVDLRTAHLNIN